MSNTKEIERKIEIKFFRISSEKFISFYMWKRIIRVIYLSIGCAPEKSHSCLTDGEKPLFSEEKWSYNRVIGIWIECNILLENHWGLNRLNTTLTDAQNRYRETDTSNIVVTDKMMSQGSIKFVLSYNFNDSQFIYTKNYRKIKQNNFQC